MASPEPIEFDAQDSAEVFDETNLTEDGEDIANFDEIVDVYDATTALGDARDNTAMDEDEFDESVIDDENAEEDEDEEVDDRLRDDLEDAPEDDDDDPDMRDEDDGVTRLAGDEVDLQSFGDLDSVTDPGDDDADKYESNRLSDEELQALGYPSKSETHTEKPDSQGSGASPDDVPDESHPRQEELLDEGLEESFPASDPVSVKRIT